MILQGNGRSATCLARTIMLIHNDAPQKPVIYNKASSPVRPSSFPFSTIRIWACITERNHHHASLQRNLRSPRVRSPRGSPHSCGHRSAVCSGWNSGRRCVDGHDRILASASPCVRAPLAIKRHRPHLILDMAQIRCQLSAEPDGYAHMIMLRCFVLGMVLSLLLIFSASVS